jgi:hypothetical protein
VSQIQATKKDLETVDWAETAKGAYGAGPDRVAYPITKLDDFLKGWYGTGEGGNLNARVHLAVMKSYKQVKDGGVACGRL